MLGKVMGKVAQGRWELLKMEVLKVQLQTMRKMWRIAEASVATQNIHEDVDTKKDTHRRWKGFR